MSLTPKQLAVLEAALKNKWEADQELEKVRAKLLGGMEAAVVSAETAVKGELQKNKTPRKPESGGVGTRIIGFFKSLDRPTATTAEVIAALSDCHPPTTRVALSRLVRNGEQLRLARDAEGNEQRGVYELVGGDS